MMNFIRDNIIKIFFVIIILIIVIVVVVSCMERPSSSSDETGYLEMENKMQNAAIKFTNKNKTLLPKTIDNPRKIQLTTLIKNNYLNEFHAQEDSRIVCTGYVYVEKKYEDKDDYRFTPHIRCGKYYETRTIAEHIIENEKVVTSDQGLYKVSLGTEPVANTDTENSEEEKVTQKERNMYYYKGEYPNNYIVLDEKMYRIIEITEDNNLKVIATSKTYDTYTWDDRYNKEYDRYYGINDYSKSRIKENLDTLYNDEEMDEDYRFFTETEKDYIVEHDFCVGKRNNEDYNIYSGAECKVTEASKVGLITVSEYYRASVSTDCNEIGEQDCNNYNYLYSLRQDGAIPVLYTLTGVENNTKDVYLIQDGDLTEVRASSSKTLYPVIYLDSNILYKSGTGTSTDPYIVR